MKGSFLSSQKIVLPGGGSGSFTLLRGLVQYNRPEYITAITSTWDSGGSSGDLRVKEGILPPGDYMQCLLGLMEDEDQLREAIIILRDRSEGHPLVNQLAVKSEKTHHGVEGGIDGLRKLLRVRGQIIPVSLVDVDLNAETKNGMTYQQEHQIDQMKNDPNFSLKDAVSRIFFDHSADANPKALKALSEATKIVFPPGSPFTSIFPHLLVRGIPGAIINSKAKLVVVLNLMTTKGEDHHLTSASRWLSVFQYYLGDNEWIKKTGRSRINYLIVNENQIDPQVLDIYQQQRQKPIEIDQAECQRIAPGIKIISKNLVTYDLQSHLLRHDSKKLAKTILDLL